ncbi:hypothetical protein Tco_0541854, partial [Tanacetum coccineum]
TITLSLPVGTTYLPARTFTLPVGTTYLLVVTIYYKIPNNKDPAFDELDNDAIDYMETEDAQDVGRTRYVVYEEKESAEKEVSTEDALNSAQPKVSTDKEEVSTDR